MYPILSGSALVRALLLLYFEGKVPEALPIALEEQQRADRDMRAKYKEEDAA